MSKKAVITILGLIGGKESHKKANYFFENDIENKKEYLNTFPLLIDIFSKEYKIVPLYTKEAKIENLKVLNKSNLKFENFDEKYFIENDKDFIKLFDIINSTVEEFDELIIDVSHGFRHLPILMIVDLIIQNFKNTSKIKQILFAKEIITYKEYEIIDLKDYLDLANISFVLSTFEKNYTVASHIKSEKYKKLLKELNDFSNDLMALNIGNLSKTAKELIIELNNVKEISIKSQAQNLIIIIQNLVNFEGKKRYLVYYNFSKDLFEKKYMLLSLALLYESIRMYIKTFIKKKNKTLVEKVEKELNNDLYKIGDFFKNLKWKNYEKFKNERNNRLVLSKEEYDQLRNSFPKHLEKLYEEIDNKRNDLAHANTRGSFQDIEKDISSLLFKYESLVIKNNSI